MRFMRCMVISVCLPEGKSGVKAEGVYGEPVAGEKRMENEKI